MLMFVEPEKILSDLHELLVLLNLSRYKEI